MNLQQFGQLMEKRATVFPAAVAAVKKKVAIAALTQIVDTTPVDTGAAISNWQVNLGSAAIGSRLAYTPGTKGSTAQSNRGVTIQTGSAVIANAMPGVPIHITNNLFYIGDLNDGTSQQAPAGFVEGAITAGLNVLKGASVLDYTWK